MRKAIAGLAAGLLLASAVPALADHVTEPTRPIVSADWRVFPYPQGALDVCQGDGEYHVPPVGENLRMELDISSDPATKENPSEHWDVLVVLSESVGTPTRPAYRNLVSWNVFHQNQPAHGRRAMESQSDNLWLDLPAGDYRLEAVVEGDASGVVLEAVCDFTYQESE